MNGKYYHILYMFNNNLNTKNAHIKITLYFNQFNIIEYIPHKNFNIIIIIYT
jgi:hypothetical protein